MKKLLILFAILLLAATACTMVGNDINPQAIGTNVKWLSCSDSDGGKNFSRFGRVTARYISPEMSNLKSYVRNDTCIGNILQEKFCNGKTPSTLNHVCPDGCIKGACKKISTCKDTDGGVFLTIKGNVTANGVTKRDMCYSDRTLIEYSCSSTNTIDTNYFYCNCANSMCQKSDSSYCKDSDGIDYSVKGTSTGAAPLGPNNEIVAYTYEDTCNGLGQATEHHCEGTQMIETAGDCANGCSDGACIEALSCANLVTDMQLSISGSDAAEFRFINNDNKVVEIPYTYNGAIFLGTAVDEPLLLPGDSYLGDPEGVMLLFTTPGGETHVLRIEDLTCGLVNKTTIKDLTYDVIVAKDARLTSGCSLRPSKLSLGSIGQVSLILQPNRIAYQRTFGDGPIIANNTAQLRFSNIGINVTSPDSNHMGMYNLYVENGNIASAYSCTEIAPVTCIDSDGEDIYNYGYITEQITGWTKTLDTCQDDKVVEERVCTNGRGANKYFDCQNGCSNGACIAQQPTCTDSDNSPDYTTFIFEFINGIPVILKERNPDLFVKGYAKGKFGDGPNMVIGQGPNYGTNPSSVPTTEPYTTYYDWCAGNHLEEAYCSGNALINHGIDCPNGCSDGACLSSNSGDLFKIERSDKKFLLYDSLGMVWINEVTQTQLPTILKEGSFADNMGNTRQNMNYRQTIKLSDLNGIFTNYTTDDPYVLRYNLRLKRTWPVYNYVLNFSNDVLFDRYGATKDFAGTSMEIQGKKYTITGVDLNPSAGLKGVTLITGDIDTWLKQDVEFIVADHKIKVIGVDPSTPKCGVWVDGTTQWINELSSQDFGAFSIGVLDVIAVEPSTENTCRLLLGSHTIKLEEGKAVMVDYAPIEGSLVKFYTTPEKWRGFRLSYAYTDKYGEDLFIELRNMWVDPIFGEWKILIDKVNILPNGAPAADVYIGSIQATVPLN